MTKNRIAAAPDIPTVDEVEAGGLYVELVRVSGACAHSEGRYRQA
jgi:hypothetical protein